MQRWAQLIQASAAPFAPLACCAPAEAAAKHCLPADCCIAAAAAVAAFAAAAEEEASLPITAHYVSDLKKFLPQSLIGSLHKSSCS